MFYLIPQIFIILSLGGITFIFLRKIVKIEIYHKNLNTDIIDKKKEDSSAKEFIKLTKKKIKFGKFQLGFRKLKDVLLKIMAKLIELLKQISLFFVKVRQGFWRVLKKIDNKLESKFKTLVQKSRDKKQAYKIKKEQKKEEQKKLEQVKKINQKKRGVEAMILEKKYIDKITENPKNIMAYQNLGRLYLDQKNFKDAKECFNHILKLEPKNKKAKKAIAALAQR